MKWIGQHIYDLVARFRDDVYLEDISTGTIVSGGNLGLDSNNKIVKATVASGSGDITEVNITTDSGGGSKASETSGSADFSLLGTSGVGVTNSGTTITVTSVPGEIDHDSLLNFASNEHFTQANISTVGTIETGVWEGDPIASAYLDSDTAHLSGNQTFSGRKTFSTTIIQDGDNTLTPGDGAALHIDGSDITDGNTSASGTAAKFACVNIEAPRLLASNASVTTSDAATLYVNNAPAAGTNQTLTRSWAMWIDGGNARFDGSIYSGTTETINSSGVVQVAAQTVIDHDQLANYAANEHFTQANITTVGTISSGTWEGTTIAIDQGGTGNTTGVQGGKNYRIYNTSFRQDIGTTKYYIPLKSQDEQTVLTREEVSELAVCDGRVVSVTLRVENLNTHAGDATVTFGVEANTVGSSYSSGFSSVETEALTINNADDQHIFHYVFDTAKHWDSTDMWAISLQSDVDISGNNERFFVTVVVEDDWSTYLGGVSREIDTTP
tara:strand:+ start:149 stop:1639 length:1491 start_codon:yes stop_codon:yes gene_type:complete